MTFPRLSRMRSLGAALTLLFALAARAAATLYSGETGYQYTAGSKGYWSHELSGQAELRVAGGWYPFGRLSVFTDSIYRGVLAPGAGVEKGFPGVGRARAGYTYSAGAQRDGGPHGTSHAVEAGFFRAWRRDLATDFSYRWISGDLFTGNDAAVSPVTGATSVTPKHLVLHQPAVAAVWTTPWGPHPPRLTGALAPFLGDQAPVYTESLDVAVPLVKGLWIHAALTLAQGSDAPRRYVSAGLTYEFAGRR
ncbi:MAG: hypothetical protein NTY77_02275 [Elusimicrobia bacterium]|nr:hypothetical protein [Elusimicrobiota bacterium]